RPLSELPHVAHSTAPTPSLSAGAARALPEMRAGGAVHQHLLLDAVVPPHPSRTDALQEPPDAAVGGLEGRHRVRRDLEPEGVLLRHARRELERARDDRLRLALVRRVPEVARHVLVALELDPYLAHAAPLGRGEHERPLDRLAGAERSLLELELEQAHAARIDVRGWL